MAMQAEKICRLTVDLYYEGEPVPCARMQFFGGTREECLEQLDDQAERDPVLRKLVDGREEVKGIRMREEWKMIKLSKIQKGMQGSQGI